MGKCKNKEEKRKFSFSLLLAMSYHQQILFIFLLLLLLSGSGSSSPKQMSNKIEIFQVIFPVRYYYVISLVLPTIHRACPLVSSSFTYIVEIMYFQQLLNPFYRNSLRILLSHLFFPICIFQLFFHPLGLHMLPSPQSLLAILQFLIC